MAASPTPSRLGWRSPACCRADLGKENWSTSEKYLVLPRHKSSPSLMLLFPPSVWRQSLSGFNKYVNIYAVQKDLWGTWAWGPAAVTCACRRRSSADVPLWWAEGSAVVEGGLVLHTTIKMWAAGPQQWFVVMQVCKGWLVSRWCEIRYGVRWLGEVIWSSVPSGLGLCNLCILSTCT